MRAQGIIFAAILYTTYILFGYAFVGRLMRQVAVTIHSLTAFGLY